MSSPAEKRGPERLVAQLRELHRLATGAYSFESQLYDAYLEVGRRILDLPRGAVLNGDGSVLAGDSSVAPVLEGPIGNSGERRIVFGGAEPGASGDPTGDREVLAMMAEGIAHGLRNLAAMAEHRRLTDELAWQAWHDSLTKLPNRSRLSATIETAILNSRPGERVAVLFIDLDRIKQVNDTLGHVAGDRLFIEVGSRIRGALRPQDSAARVGADEFVVVAPGVRGAEHARQIATRLLERLREPHAMAGYQIYVTASIGVSLFPDHGWEPDMLVRAADAAMYTAKRQGRNDVRVFTSELTVYARTRFELETDLRSALEHGELQLLYQPILRIDGTFESLEVLLTWNSPRFGRLPAARFVPIAEEAGMIVPIGSWVLAEACRQCAAWVREGRGPGCVSVNVSALQFARTDFVDTVIAALQESGLDAARLELEITETAVMRDVAEAERCFGRLRKLGVRVAIDDFGAGYSSLGYLRDLSVDGLKIDKAFLRNGPSVPKGVALIQAILAMAHNLGLPVTAEGVEEPAQLEILRGIGCDRVQGNLLGEAMPLEEVERQFRTPRN